MNTIRAMRMRKGAGKGAFDAKADDGNLKASFELVSSLFPLRESFLLFLLSRKNTNPFQSPSHIHLFSFIHDLAGSIQGVLSILPMGSNRALKRC